MKIDNIKINGFGKIKNKNIDFKDGINIVYGENESGKSTVLKFISTMLYGISKNKNGKEISDFDKYKPWDDSEFSGKIKYTLDNGKAYEVFREFKKKSPVIYNEFEEDISKEFTVGKGKEVNFFEQQVKVDENIFSNTAIIGQQEVKLAPNDTNSIIQKISNLVSTGNDNISFKKSLEKINKMQNENIGTDRTKQRPLNVVNSKIDQLIKDKKKINEYKENTDIRLKNKQQLINKVEQLQIKKQFLKETKDWFEKLKIKDIELDFQRNLEKEYSDKVQEVQEKINSENECDKNKNNQFKGKIYLYSVIFFIIATLLVTIFIKNIFASLLTFIPIIIIYGIAKKNKNKDFDKLKKLNQELAKEHESSINNYNKKKKEIKEKEKQIEFENNKIQKTLLVQYKKKINVSYIENIFNMDSSEIENEIENVNNSINELNLEIHILKNEKQNIDEKLEQLLKIEEELQEQKNIKEELMSLDISYNIAKECLEKAYEEIKHNISPKFEKNLCEIVSIITNGKYNKITINDEKGICVEIENGVYMPVNRLSIGTIDEMYLSLRLSTLLEISDESLPIILDETFAYFDNNRLKNIMNYLQSQNYNNQIIIFTCSNREEDILNDLKIEYNLINLEK